MGANCVVSNFILLKFACVSSVSKCFADNFSKERLEGLTCVYRVKAEIEKTFTS